MQPDIFLVTDLVAAVGGGARRISQIRRNQFASGGIAYSDEIVLLDDIAVSFLCPVAARVVILPPDDLSSVLLCESYI